MQKSANAEALIHADEKIAYKVRLRQFCEILLNERIAATREAMTNAQAAANAEGKSSAGDKYETSRAMSHLEKDMHARQLLAHTEQLSALLEINVNVIYSTAVAGSFIRCENINIFVATGLAKHSVNDVDIIFISPQSPLAKKLTGKKNGDLFDMNGPAKIVEIF